MTATARPRTTVVTVAHDSGAVLGAMLASLPAGTPVIIVDNASTDRASLARLAADHGATLLRNDRNAGFGVACNQGAALAQGEFVLFVNPDTTLDPGCIAALEQGLDRHAGASAANPVILNANGSNANKHGSVLLPRTQRLPADLPTKDHPVPILTGSVLMVRLQAFRALGGFDPNIFLYHEDDDLALRLKASCGPLYIFPTATARHLQGQSSPRAPGTARFKAFHMGRSRVYAARKHGRPFALTAALCRAVLNLLSPDMLWSPRRRAKNAGFLAGVLSMARSAPPALTDPPFIVKP